MIAVMTHIAREVSAQGVGEDGECVLARGDGTWQAGDGAEVAP